MLDGVVQPAEKDGKTPEREMPQSYNEHVDDLAPCSDVDIDNMRWWSSA
jgi:hypothetical protein